MVPHFVYFSSMCFLSRCFLLRNVPDSYSEMFFPFTEGFVHTAWPPLDLVVRMRSSQANSCGFESQNPLTFSPRNLNSRGFESQNPLTFSPRNLNSLTVPKKRGLRKLTSVTPDRKITKEVIVKTRKTVLLKQLKKTELSEFFCRIKSSANVA